MTLLAGLWWEYIVNSAEHVLLKCKKKLQLVTKISHLFVLSSENYGSEDSFLIILIHFSNVTIH